MEGRIIDFENVFTQSFFECCQSPNSLSPRVDRFRHLAHVPGDLRIAGAGLDPNCMLVVQISVRRPNRNEPAPEDGSSWLGFRWRRQESLEIGALELRAAIYDENLGQATMSPDGRSRGSSCRICNSAHRMSNRVRGSGGKGMESRIVIHGRPSRRPVW